jgi:dihydroanticapsin dehydrogenase
MRLSKRKALLVGAATGIGKETAFSFAREGADLVIADINESGAKKTVDEIKAVSKAVDYVPIDVTDEQKVAAAVEYAVTKLNGLDIVVNLAGLQRSGVVSEFPTASWDDIFNVNVRGQFLVIRYALPALKLSKHASIINMASIAGLRGGPGMTAYSASKGAVIAFSRALAMELAPGIRVNSVCPGWIDTPFNQAAIDFMGGIDRLNALVASSVPLGRQGRPKEIAPIIVFLASDDSSYMTGQSVVIDGGQI